MLSRATASSKEAFRVVRDYLSCLPEAASRRSALGDRMTAERYIAAADRLLDDSTLPKLTVETAWLAKVDVLDARAEAELGRLGKRSRRRFSRS